MILLSDLFAQLSVGELSNHTMSNEGAGIIKTGFQDKLKLYINDGLRELYSRYILSEKRIRIELHDDIGYYYLEARFATNYTPSAPGASDDMPVRYILDSSTVPFIGDVLKVLYIFDEHVHKCEVPLNDEEQPHAIFTPRPHLLQIPCEHFGETLDVVYQAKHRTVADLTDVISLPEVLLPALRNFIAYKVYSHMATDRSTSKAAEFMATFEEECDKVVGRDMVNSSISWSNSRFEKRGWV